MIDLTQGAWMAPGSDEILSSSPGAIVRRTILPGGVRVLSEQVTGMRSVTIGAWVSMGSRDEIDGHHGSTHFLEHLLFKGTQIRSALDIASAFDAVGGDANAATAKEYTCYYARVLDTDAAMATEVILDMVTSAVIDADEFEIERGVILEELAMSQDDPTEVVAEAFSGEVFGNHPLGRPIGGTPQTITDVPREAVWEHYQTRYCPSTLVISAAGGVDHHQLVELVRTGLARGGWDSRFSDHRLDYRQFHTDTAPIVGRSDGSRNVRFVERPVEQAHVILGGMGLRAGDDRRFAMSVLNAVLGGSMSSRLFQEVREKRALAYSVYSFASEYRDTGQFGMYAGCLPQKVSTVVEVLNDQLELLAAEGISEEELNRGIGQVRGGAVLSQEDSASRMTRLGRVELGTGPYLTIDEVLARMAEVSVEDVQRLAATVLESATELVVVGPAGTRL